MKDFASFLVLLLLVLLLWSFKLQLVATDLGRHLQNGSLLLENPELLYTNFYSFTFPEFPFNNHHWLSGLIFSSIYKAFSFWGLNLFFILLIAVTLYIFWRTGTEFSPPFLVSLFSLTSLLVISQRQELRPEFFSYLLLGLEFFLLWKVKTQKIPSYFLALLPFLQVIWANLHIFFWIGLGLQFLFVIDSLLNNQNLFLKFFLTLAFSFLGTLCSPFGLENLSYPYFLVHNYGYKIVENQSLFFVIKRTKPLSGFLFLGQVLFLVALLLVSLLLRKISLREDLLMIFLSFSLSLAGVLAFRNIFLFSWFFIILASYFWRKIKPEVETETVLVFFSSLLLFYFLFIFPLKMQEQEFGWGAERAALEFLKFVKENPLPGRIFNNYDIGSFLIFSLFPEKKVFIDNRPEAYPVSFFQEYTAMQEDVETFQKLSAFHGIETIIFYWKDLTPWAQHFLTQIVYDPNWLPVFANEKIVVLVKNTERNRKIWKDKILPRRIFKVVPTL